MGALGRGVKRENRVRTPQICSVLGKSLVIIGERYMAIVNNLLRIWRKMFPKPDPEPYFLKLNHTYEDFQVGEWSYGKPLIKQFGEREPATLHVGNFCSIARGVTILLGGNHRTDLVTSYPFSVVFSEADAYPGHPTSRGDVYIGHDVWIGWGTLILSGVTIGNGAVIGAGSVVTRNVPPYAIVAGNPAQVIRYRFSQSQIEELQRIAWWDWPLDRIKAAWPLLLSSDIETFIASYRQCDHAQTSGEPICA